MSVPIFTTVSSITTQNYTDYMVGKILLVGGLSANSEYTYTLTVASRGDIGPVSGAFRTSAGSSSAAPTAETSIDHRDTTSLLFTITPAQYLKMFEVTLTDQVTQAVKKYSFFDLFANTTKILLLDSLDAGRRYMIGYLMVDANGRCKLSGGGWYISTLAFDEAPPAIIESALIERTATSARLRVTVSEILTKLRVRYRIAGTTQWLEKDSVLFALTSNVSLTGLTEGQLYDYQCILEDNNGNQFITECAVM